MVLIGRTAKDDIRLSEGHKMSRAELSYTSSFSKFFFIFSAASGSSILQLKKSLSGVLNYISLFSWTFIAVGEAVVAAKACCMSKVICSSLSISEYDLPKLFELKKFSIALSIIRNLNGLVFADYILFLFQ